jgi:hypothetical protein
MSKPTLKVTSDFTKQFNDVIKKFQHDDVLVGIPEDTNGRKDDTEAIGNAALLAILNFGSTLNNIPPWPVMAMGIQQAKDEIAAQFRKCAKDTLVAAVKGQGGGFDIIERYYTRAGIIASTSVKKVINSQEDAPALAHSTLIARKARGFKGESRGIVTGQMRNAITYVVRSKVA